MSALLPLTVASRIPTTTPLPPPLICERAGDQLTAGIHQSTWSTRVNDISPSYQLSMKAERDSTLTSASESGSVGSMPYFASMALAKPFQKSLPVDFCTVPPQNA